jgi:microcystin degradation protein MlrC
MSAIRDFAEFEAQLAEARVGMNQLLRTYPGDDFLESIARQLGFVFEWTRGGKRPTAEQIKKLSFGVMASRSVDELNPDLAQSLYRLANFLDNWP